jgi:uncharacterized protein
MHTVGTCDPAALASRAGAWLEAEPVLHNVICTVLARARKDPARFVGAGWFVVEEGHRPVGVAMLTPPYPLALTPMPDAALAALAEALRERRPLLPGVAGHHEVATRFTTLWQERTGAGVEPGMEQWLYRLTAVVPLPTSPGRFRAAREDDRPRLREWFASFAAEAAVERETDAQLDRWLAHGGMYLWEDGPVVSMAAASPPVAGVVRISAVYSPPEVRGRGYATSCVASLSQRALDFGATACMLYADQANPTPNAIYRRIGYRPVSHSREYRFSYG